MASAANASSTPKPGGPKNARPPIVPVIPLPFVHKQQKAIRLQEQKKKEEDLIKQRKKELEAKQLYNEAQKQKQREKEEQSEELAQEQTQQQTPVQSIEAPINGVPSDLPSSPPPSIPQSINETAQSIPEPSQQQPTVLSTTAAPSSASSVSVSSATPTAVPFPEPSPEGPKKLSDHANSIVSSRPVTSPSGLPTNNAGNHGMPDFVFPQPRNGPSGRFRGPRPAFNAPHPSFHQGHSSNNSATFGALHDSNNTSPAPNARGPVPPPPSAMPGPPLFIPYNASNPAVADWAGPPAVAPLSDVNGGLTPSAGGFNSSTPGGSFHGSQSPENVVDGPFSAPQVAGPFPMPVQNGNLPRNDSMPNMMSPPYYPPHGLPGNGPPPSDQHLRDGLPAPHGVIDFGLVQHLQQQMHSSFDTPQTADCHLFLHIIKPPKLAASDRKASNKLNATTDQSAPMVFAGHRVVLSQSYTIGRLLRSDVVAAHPGPFNQPIFTVPVRIEDPYISMGAAMQALRSLYGFPIEDLSGPGLPGTPDIIQAVDEALANLTAGFLFMLQHVEMAGAEQAIRSIGWHTIETILAFCLNGASYANSPPRGTDPFGMPYPEAQFRYGRGAALPIRLLLRKSMDFLVENFPPDFVFVTTNADNSGDRPVSLSRFPAQASSKREMVDAQTSRQDKKSPILGQGSHTSHPRSGGSVSLPASHDKHAARTPQIVFGDFAPRDGNTTLLESNGALTTDQQAKKRTGTEGVLSRVLVNLPFGYLCHVLEHPLLRVTEAARKALVQVVVAEREQCRMKTLADLRAGRIHVPPSEQEAALSRVLFNGPPPMHRDFPVDGWDVLGWREVCLAEGSKMAQAWGQIDG